MHPTLNIAIKAARRAGSVINRGSLNLDTINVQMKQANDFVTEIDQAAERAIIEVIQEAYPDHCILAEESGQNSNTDSDFQWIIDPLDGTTNFIHGFPQYAVSIALAEKGILQHAVIYDPSRNELFTASRGRGAYLNDRRIRVSKRIRLQECLIGTGFPFKTVTHMDAYLKMFRDISEKAAGLRRPGAAALDLAYVACGRFDGFFEIGLMPWDMAAGVLMITEAGGLVSDFAGEADYLTTGNLIAGNPKVFGQILPMIQTHRSDALRA